MTTQQPPPPCRGPGECPPDGSALAALIDQLRQNWDTDDHAANDDLVIRIRELIRSQRESGGPEYPDGAEDDEPLGPDEPTRGAAPMHEHTKAVVDDVDYWSEHGVQVVSVRARVDGPGAVVGVRRLTNTVIAAMQARYAFPVYCWDAPVL